MEDYYKYMAPMKGHDMYSYIIGSREHKLSIAGSRDRFFADLTDTQYGMDMKVALKDPKSDNWTKWVIYGHPKRRDELPDWLINSAYDVHRSMLTNEIVVESDYPTYEENREAAICIGKFLEEKGYLPHYYYSGSKSIHIHIFLDFLQFRTLPDETIEKIRKHYSNAKDFQFHFISWMRFNIITMWGTKLRQFDQAFLKSTHLVRAELSCNKKGFKTFLGYTWEKIPEQPLICNAETREYPEIATINPSPNALNEHPLLLTTLVSLETIIEQFLKYIDIMVARRLNDKTRSGVDKIDEIRPLVKLILDDKFKETQDGFKRGLFILANELHHLNYPAEKIRQIVTDWNIRMGEPLRTQEIEHKINRKDKYRLTNTYIKSFLESLGIKT